MPTGPLRRLRRLFSKPAWPLWFVLAFKGAWKGVETLSTFDFLTHRVAGMMSFIPAHVGLVVNVVCFMGLAAIVLWPVRHKSAPSSLGPLAVSHCSLESCDFCVPNKVEPGSSHRILSASFVNNSNAQPRGNIRGLRAEATYFDSKGDAYLTVPNVLWRNGEDGIHLLSGQSAQLLLALIDPKGNPFAVGHTETWDYDEHQHTYSGYRSEVRRGHGTVRVRLTYSFQKESSTFLGDDPTDEAQEFNFKIDLGDKLQIKQA